MITGIRDINNGIMFERRKENIYFQGFYEDTGESL